MDALPAVMMGLALLVALAWIIGRVEANARNGAWQRIAEARRDLQSREQSLLSCITGTPCPDCPVRRYLNDR